MKRHTKGADGLRSAAMRVVAVGLLLWCCIVGCQEQAGEPTGGETHFLRLCDADAGSCAEGLACLCGVCTTTCSVDDPCAQFPGAQCVAQASSMCGGSSVRACDVLCTADDECRALSGNHHCIDGWCRLASSSAAPAGEGGEAGQTPDACPSSGVGANEVVVLGDSFFATTHEVTGFLEGLARDSGVLSAGERYRDYSNLTSNALAAGENGIEGQYDAAIGDSEVSVVIMNGGGADMLIGPCDPVDASCPAIANAVTALEALLARMAADGIDHVVFVSYPDPEPADVLEKIVVLRPLLRQTCASSTVPCHFVELQADFEGNQEQYLADDGLNPTAAGAEVSAGAIWSVMQDECIAQ